MLKNQGFTLIELVIVIIVLGILSAVAVPKFVNLGSDARIASLNGIKGALSSTSSLVEMKAKIEGVTMGKIEINGKRVKVKNSYIEARWNNAWRNALELGGDVLFTISTETCTLYDICGVGLQAYLGVYRVIWFLMVISFWSCFGLKAQNWKICVMPFIIVLPTVTLPRLALWMKAVRALLLIFN